jgi:D-ribose pyranase
VKRRGILNAELSGAIARLGHMDVVLLADCGMPTPAGVPVVDLALVHGVPRFEQVLDALLDELVFERCVAAEEAKSAPAGAWLAERFTGIEYISHDRLKELSASAKLFIRTGEATPFANAACHRGFCRECRPGGVDITRSCARIVVRSRLMRRRCAAGASPHRALSTLRLK